MDLHSLEAQADAARTSLAQAQAEALRRGRRPMRRFRAIARTLIRGVSLPATAGNEGMVAQWRQRALLAEVERDLLRDEVAGRRIDAEQAILAAAAARTVSRRFAQTVDRLAARSIIEPASVIAPESTTDYAQWIARTLPAGAVTRVLRDAAKSTVGPIFSIIMPVFRVPFDVLRDTVNSVLAQTYPHWQLCIVHADASDITARRWLRSIAQTDERVVFRAFQYNAGIAANSNAALELATGDFAVLLDHDDMLVEHALSCFAQHLHEHPDIDFLYSDKDMTDEGGSARIHPLFKPQWSPETMLTVNYVTHCNALRLSIIREIGGWRPETDGAQDWDLFLRFAERTSRIVAIRDVLYRWRMVSTSVAGGGLGAKPYALAAQVRTLEESLGRRGVSCRYDVDADGVTLHPHWETLPAAVTVVVMCRPGDAEGVVAEVARRCNRQVTEILVPLPVSQAFADGRARTVDVASDTSTAGMFNAAIGVAQNDVTIVIDGGSIAPDADDWIAELVGPLVIPGVGISAPLILDGTSDRIAHTGLVFDLEGRAHELFRGGTRDTYTPIGSARWIRNVSAVGGGVFAIRTEVAGRYPIAERPEHARRDIDMCLRAVRGGWRIVYTPFVSAREVTAPALAQSVEAQARGEAMIRLTWPDGDPCFHPALLVDGPVVRFRLPQQHPAPANDYSGEARALAGFFDASAETMAAARNTASPHRRWRTASWVLPDFTHSYYGGVATILRFAAYLAERHDVISTFVVAGLTPPEVLRERIGTVFPVLHDANFSRVESFAEIAELPRTDAAIATLWTTAYYLQHLDAEARFYFVQDNEAQFYPAGTTSALVEATYRFGYRAICNTVALAQMMRGYGADAVHFTPAIDPLVFHRGNRPARSGPHRLFIYGRPGHSRNGFELLAAAARVVKEHFGDRIDIVTAGAPWSPAAYGLDGIVTNLGLLGYRSTGELYRSCDIGAVMMMTSHPSYLPMELMACGAAVVTNLNPRTAWLLRDGDNAFLAETTVAAFAQRIVDALEHDRERVAVCARAATFIQSERSDWNREWDALVENLWP